MPLGKEVFTEGRENRAGAGGSREILDESTAALHPLQPAGYVTLVQSGETLFFRGKGPGKTLLVKPRSFGIEPYFLCRCANKEKTH